MVTPSQPAPPFKLAISIFRTFDGHGQCTRPNERMFKSSKDIELAAPKKEYANGFASVAAFIAKDADNTSTIYHRFDRLAARNLLHLQSKLQNLGVAQDELDDDCLGTHDRDSTRAATSREDFESLAEAGGSEEERMEAAREMERASKTYRW